MRPRLSVFLVLLIVFAQMFPPAPVKALNSNISITQPAYSVLSPQVQSAGGADWQIVGQVGGPTQGVAVRGSKAYVGVGLRLIVLDISDPANPHQVGATAPFRDFVESLTVSGTLAFVAAGGGGLRILDVADPAHPQELGAWTSPGFAQGVAVAGSIAYVADGPYGLRVLDVSNPVQPVEIGSAFVTSYAYGVAVSGSYAYLASAGAGLLIADISNPSQPVEVGSFDTPGYAYAVAVAGSYAYVGDGWEGLKVIDITDRSDPKEAGHYQTSGNAFGVAVSGSRVYVADAFKGLRVIDVTNAGNPFELGGYEEDGGHAGSVAVVGSIVYVADRGAGLRAIGVADPVHPSQIGLYAPLGFADAVALSGNYAYVAAGRYGLYVIDISDQATPREVASLPIVSDSDTYATAVAVVGNYAYVCNGMHLYAADVSDPSQPVWGGTANSGGMCRGMSVANGKAYIANEWGLSVVSLADPLHPAAAGSLQTWGWGGAPDAAVGVAVSGTVAYLASSYAGLRLVNVSDPQNMSVIGSITRDNSPIFENVAVANGRAYLAGAGLWTVDISNPSLPSEMSYLASTGQPLAVAVLSDTAYLASSTSGLWSVDLSDPAHPVDMGTLNTLGFSYDVSISGERAYLADGPDGLLLLGPSSGGGSPTVPGKSDALKGRWQAAAHSTAFSPSIPSDNQGGLPNLPSGISRSATSAFENSSAEITPAGSNCVVTSSSDSGIGSLRSCLEGMASGTTISFDPEVFPPGSPTTIALAGPLPDINQDGITIDASSSGVILDGAGISGYAFGLNVGSEGNVIRGLQIQRFSGNGISVWGRNNVIGRGNIVGGNGGFGIYISGRGARDNVVMGNMVGTDASGTHANGNGKTGIMVIDGSTGNLIGGPDPSDRNVVGGNGENGITMQFASSGNRVLGNYVGVDITGNSAIGNRGHGISVEVGGFNNLIQGNVSSGNNRTGIIMSDWGSSYNTVVGNFVGTDASGTQAIPNSESGIHVGYQGASFNRIGGTTPEERNVVSGNSQGGITAVGIGVGNLILGNYIGTDSSGTRALGNYYEGVSLFDVGRSIIGGTAPGEGNLVAGNRFGISVSSDYNFIAGNRLGLVFDGPKALGNQSQNTWIRNGAHNVIQGNEMANSVENAGVQLETVGANTLRRNSIYHNFAQGIFFSPGLSPLIPPTVITVTATGASGTACPGCTVEVFSDAEDEGRFYEGDTLASASGSFSFDKGAFLMGPKVTATATDSTGNTSAFSAPQSTGRASTVTTITGKSSSVSVVGQAVSVSFTVTATGSGGTPGGMVTVSSGSSNCTATLPAVSCGLTLTSAGVRNLVATYGGDNSFDGSVSSVVTQTVSKADTTTALVASPNPSTLGQTVTFTSTVTSPGGTPTGLVTFRDGSTVLGSASLSGGKAVFTLASLAVGTHSITSVYVGDANFNGSTSASLSQRVNGASVYLPLVVASWPGGGD